MSYSYYISSFLKTELTNLPKILNKYTGNHYNNALSNGATWIFILWCVLHLVFDRTLEILFKKMCFKGYIRSRLKSSLWYLGFYGSAFIYCSSTLFENNIELVEHTQMHLFNNGNIPIHIVVGYLLLCTFFAQSAIWEGLCNGLILTSINYLLLTLFVVTTYFLRTLEYSFILISLISITQMVLELTRCVTSLSKFDSTINKYLNRIFFAISLLLLILIFIFIIPLMFIVPFGLKTLWKSPSFSVILFNTTLIAWLLTAMFNSIILKVIKHWLYHNEKTSISECPGDIIECSLFLPRDDDAHNLKIIRKEIKDRQAKMISMRKPKNRNMLIQTLKCMVAIKRKLNEKRMSDSSDSDDSDKSESENKDTNDKEKEDDTESDDEASEFEDDVPSTEAVKTENQSGDVNEDAPKENGVQNEICNENDAKKNNVTGEELISSDEQNEEQKNEACEDS